MPRLHISIVVNLLKVLGNTFFSFFLTMSPWFQSDKKTKKQAPPIVASQPPLILLGEICKIYELDN